MRFPGPAVLAAIGMLAGAVASAGGPHEYEPTAEEKRIQATVDRWRAQGLAAAPEMIAALCRNDAALSVYAHNELLRIGQPAVPLMVRKIAADPSCRFDEVIGYDLCNGVAEADVIEMLRSRQPALVRAGAESLWYLFIKDEPDCVQAAARLKPRVVPELGKQLRTASGEAFRAVLSALSRVGPIAAPLVPDLIPLLARDEITANSAAAVLDGIGPGAAAAVPALRAMFARGEPFRYWATKSLGAIGAAAQPALPDFAAPFKQALSGLCDKGRFNRTAGGIIETFLQAASRIGGPGVEPLVPDAVAALAAQRRCDIHTSRLWIGYFGGFGRYGAAALPLLRTIVEDPDADLAERREALASIDLIGMPEKWRRTVEPLRKAFALKAELFKQRRREPDPDLEGDLQVPDPTPRPPTTPRAFRLCREEAGLRPLEEPADPPSDGPNHSGFAICVEHRLCGPSEADYRATMARCCGWYTKPHAGPSPWFCAKR